MADSEEDSASIASISCASEEGVSTNLRRRSSTSVIPQKQRKSLDIRLKPRQKHAHKRRCQRI